jgi:hypothetical protein
MVAFVLTPTVCDAAKPINNLRNQTVPVMSDGSHFSLDKVQEVIIEACLARGWQPTVEGDGVVTATINVRGRHYAKIEIPFTENNYSILYVESNNLDYNAERQKIHRNYNNWVVKLSGTIGKYFRVVHEGSRATDADQAATDAAQSYQDDVYTKLLKLDELREKGILTDEEFEKEKRKVLGQN